MNNLQQKKPDFKERRQVPRVKKVTTVKYTIRDFLHMQGFKINVDVEPPTEITRTKDLSEKGMFFTSGHAIFKESILDIRMRLSLQEVSLAGRVVSCREIMKNCIYEIRVEFVGIGDRERNSLRQFVNYSTF